MTTETTTAQDLASQSCAACQGLEKAMSKEAAQSLINTLQEGWSLSEDGKSMTRAFTFKGFAKATYTANLAAFIGDKEKHHPDIAFGWGYCHITFTTHEAGGLTQNDFICAAKLDQAVG